MKDELQGKLVEILTGIQTAVGKASDFAIEQLPDIALQYVMWGRVNESIHMAINILFVIIGILFIRWVIKDVKENCFEDHHGFIAMFALATTGINLVIALSNISTLLMVWFAPKVWLIKEIARLVK